MPSKQCVVIGCDTSYSDVNTPRHRFPKNEAIFNTWVERSGNNKLLNMPMDEVYKRFVMCDKHFAPNCKSPEFKKLILTSVPTLKLPDYNLEDNVDMTIKILTETFDEETIHKMPFASETFDEDTIHQMPFESQFKTAGPTRPLLPKRLFEGTLKEINIRRKTDLTPRKNLLYNVAKRYKQKHLMLSQRYVSAKNRISKAEKYMNNNSKSLSRLNSITLNFIESQIRMQPQQPRGRRFTVDDKVFALSLYKQSGKAYKMLSKVFALPSRKCIIDMLKKIPFQTGINKRIFVNLKNVF